MAEVIDRNEQQLKMANVWLEGPRRNTLILGTGFGKSRVTMLILERLFSDKTLNSDSKILLLVDSQNLRDDTWRLDFDKWGFSWMWPIITAECYQTVYKWKDTKWDLVIADEIDFSFTDEYHKVFANNEISMLLGLTGYSDASKDLMLSSIAPPLVSYTTQEAQNDGILNKTQLVLVEFDLSRNNNDIKVEYLSGGKTKSFSQSENDAYDYAENQFNVISGKLKRIREDTDVILGLSADKVKEAKTLEYKLKRAIANRKSLLYNGINSSKVAQQVITRILENPGSKALTFSTFTDQADRINSVTYHGKNKKGNTALSDLSLGNVRSVGVCKAVNRGVNLDGVNNLILESYDSSKTSFTQRHGRGCRLKPDQTMYLFVLLPHYHKKIKSPENNGTFSFIRRRTQMVKWAESMMEDYLFNEPIRIYLNP